MGIFLSNAFSLNMVKGDCILSIKQVSDNAEIEQIMKSNPISAIGHQSTASYIKAITGFEVATNRINLTLESGDKILVLQLLSRLPEGAILTEEELRQVPSKWYLVEVLPSETLEALYHW